MMGRYTLRILQRNKNLVGVVGATAGGVSFPSFGQWLEPLIIPIVVFLIYVSIHNIRFREADFQAYLPMIGAILAITYIGLPAISLGIAPILQSDGTLIGLFVVMAAPTTAGSAIIWTQLSNGDVFLSTIASAVSILVAPLASSAVLLILLQKHVSVLASTIALKLSVIIGGALLLRIILPEDTMNQEQLDKASQAAIVVLVYIGVAKSGFGNIALLHAASATGAVIILLLSGLLMAILCGRLLNIRNDQILPIFFAGTFKNLGISVLIAVSFPYEGVVPVIVIYYVLQQITGAVITDRRIMAAPSQERRVELKQ